MNPKIVVLFSSMLIAVTLHGQTQQPVMVPAQNVPPAAPAAQTAPTSPASAQALTQTLQQMKATNAEMLRRQQATLQQLDEIEKAIEQVKIYSRRG
ncbi:MAG: hypothetical protein M3372_06645 [Verrucomicrobiota bacterium]|nr:hypothetical protein [Verrucomicrobiota bacterium]